MIEWQRGWRAFDAPEKEDDFLQELALETGPMNPQHPLHGKECRILGWAGHGWKDFILHLPSDDHWAWVHRTWSRETAPDYPGCKVFESVDALNAFLRDGA